jgi:UDP-sulfoquinovose synthase
MKIVLIASLLPYLASCFTVPAPRAITTAAHKTTTALQQAVNGENGLAEKKKVIVLGGDGFCGWPTSLYLSDQGHDVVVVDNLSRRNIDTELGCDSLTPIQPMEVCSFYCPLS